MADALFQNSERCLCIFKILNLGDDIRALCDKIFQRNDGPVAALKNNPFALTQLDNLLLIFPACYGKKDHILAGFQITVLGNGLYPSEFFNFFRISRRKHDAVRAAFKSSRHHSFIIRIHLNPYFSHHSLRFYECVPTHHIVQVSSLRFKFPKFPARHPHCPHRGQCLKLPAPCAWDPCVGTHCGQWKPPRHPLQWSL